MFCRMKKLIGSVEELRRECDELKSHLDQLNSPIVFCHNDLMSKNMIYSQNDGTCVRVRACVCVCVTVNTLGHFEVKQIFLKSHSFIK